MGFKLSQDILRHPPVGLLEGVVHHGDMSCHFNMLIKKARKKPGKQDFDVDKCMVSWRVKGGSDFLFLKSYVLRNLLPLNTNMVLVLFQN